MRQFSAGVMVLMAAMVLGVCVLHGQDSTATQTPSTTESHTTKRHVHRRSTANGAGTTQVIPLESAPPSPPPSPAAEAAQRAKDQQLLKQQQQQSAQAAQITNQQVQKAQQQQDSVQKEVRIQDAPGPAQTGVVPASGPPVVPSNTDQRIQDAPGPAQTLPQPQQTSPPKN